MNLSRIKKAAFALIGLPLTVHRTYQRLQELEKKLDEFAAGQRRITRYGFHNGERVVFFHNSQEGNDLIRCLLTADGPAMIARHGHVELIAAANYEIANSIPNLDALHINAGFFPKDLTYAKRWAALYLACLREIDCLCEWNFREGRFIEVENLFGKYHPKSQIISNLGVLTPFFEDSPWTQVLEDKRILVIHPFEQSIRRQYAKRELLFENPQVLPRFKELLTIKAVQTNAGTEDPRFKTWFDAYEWMCAEINKLDFDIALIAAGAYGLPLAAHVKRGGAKAVHIGAGLQLLFGIQGARWESQLEKGIGRLVNQHWTRPLPEERPAGADMVEKGCYW